MSLTETLASLGLTTAPANNFWSAGSKHILRNGVIVFTGDAKETWAWINQGMP
jgi:hypothetical protein